MGFLRRIVTLYRTQIELLWRWRSGRRALIKRTLVALVASVIAFHITAWLLPQLDINELGGALVAVLVIAALNLVVRPVILGLVASRSVVALVVLTLLFQAAVILLLGRFVPAVTVGGGILGALIISFVFGGIAGAIGLVFGLDEDESYYGTLVRTLASRRPDVDPHGPARPRRHPARRPLATTCCRTRCAPAACPRSRAGSAPARTSWATGTRCCRRRRRPARPASCTATTTASPTSAGSRRRPARSSWPTIPRTPPSSRAASRTARGCSAWAARRSATSSPATASAPSW